MFLRLSMIFQFLSNLLSNRVNIGPLSFAPRYSQLRQQSFQGFYPQIRYQIFVGIFNSVCLVIGFLHYIYSANFKLDVIIASSLVIQNLEAVYTIVARVMAWTVYIVIDIVTSVQTRLPAHNLSTRHRYWRPLLRQSIEINDGHHGMFSINTRDWSRQSTRDQRGACSSRVLPRVLPRTVT